MIVRFVIFIITIKNNKYKIYDCVFYIVNTNKIILLVHEI